MTLLEIRNLFIDLSGREDLATDLVDGALTTPRGVGVQADMFINTAVRQLDLWQETVNTLRAYIYPLGANIKVFELPACAAIDSISMVGSTETQAISFQVYQIQMDPYGQATPRSDTSLRTYQYSQDSGDYAAVAVELDAAYETGQTLLVKGYFYTPYLLNNSSRNYWSEQYPLTLVHAALYALEGSYRNIEGMKAWKVQIDETLNGIDKKLAQREMGPGRLIMGNVR